MAKLRENNLTMVIVSFKMIVGKCIPKLHAHKSTAGTQSALTDIQNCADTRITAGEELFACTLILKQKLIRMNRKSRT